jgi:phosphoribosylformylglycinamidine synthase
MVEVQPSPSILFDGMAGSRMPIVVAHGEGYADFSNTKKLKAAQELVTLRYVDNTGKPTEIYPLNPNGSPQGITGLTTPDGRFSIMMPHPERVFRAVQNSWYPRKWQENGAWLRMFQNARKGSDFVAGKKKAARWPPFLCHLSRLLSCNRWKFSDNRYPVHRRRNIFAARG